MTAFLKKVEAYTRKGDKVVFKPVKPKKPKKNLQTGNGLVAPVKPAKTSKPTKAKKFQRSGSPATAKPLSNVAETNFAHLRKIMPTFEKYFQGADPFNIGDATWGKFFAEAAPLIMVNILFDLDQVTENKDRALLLRYFKQRVKSS